MVRRTLLKEDIVSRTFNSCQMGQRQDPRSSGIILRTNGPLLFVLIDNWCYTIIIVPGPRTKAFDLRNLVPSYVMLQFLDELFSCPTIYKIPETLSQ